MSRLITADAPHTNDKPLTPEHLKSLIVPLARVRIEAMHERDLVAASHAILGSSIAAGVWSRAKSSTGLDGYELRAHLTREALIERSQHLGDADIITVAGIPLIAVLNRADALSNAIKAIDAANIFTAPLTAEEIDAAALSAS